MIKIERRDTAKAQRAIEDLQEARRLKSSYNTESVNQALREIFYGKCYICENKKATSYQIEHLIPHRGEEKLRYDWQNLFLSCAHCNNIKSDKYEPVLDCTKEPVEKLIAFRKKGYFGSEERLEFTACVEADEKIKNTIALLEDAYYGTTPQKKMASYIKTVSEPICMGLCWVKILKLLIFLLAEGLSIIANVTASMRKVLTL